MSYQQRLNPWVVNKLLPNLKQLTVSRFRRRNLLADDAANATSIQLCADV